MSPVRTVTSHAVAAGVVVGATVLGSVVAYVGLLAWAVLADEGLGGPMALPFMMLVALVAGVAAVLLVLGPATLIADALCAARAWPKWAAIPASTGVTLAICLAAGALLGARHSSVGDGVSTAAIAALALLAPLGLYWWSLRGASLLLRRSGRALRAVTGRFRSPTTA